VNGKISPIPGRQLSGEQFGTIFGKTPWHPGGSKEKCNSVLARRSPLEYEYKIVEVADDPRHIVFQIKRQSLNVNV
jgi:hypothetical protein